MMRFPLLHTERLILREIGQADAAMLFELYSDPIAMKWFGAEPITEMEEVRKRIERWALWRNEPNPGVRWGIELRDEPSLLIGTVGLFRWNVEWRHCNIGYDLLPHAQGQGLAREAVHEVLRWGFDDTMQLHRVQAQIHPENVSSISLVRALGFVDEGRQRDIAFWGDRFHDLSMFSLLAPDFARLTG